MKKQRERATRAEVLRICLEQEPIPAKELPDVLIVLRDFMEKNGCTVFVPGILSHCTVLAPGVLSHTDFMALLDKTSQHEDEANSAITPG